MAAKYRAPVPSGPAGLRDGARTLATLTRVTEVDEERILEAAGPRLRKIAEKPLVPDTEVTV